MAPLQKTTGGDAGEGEVSNCVSNLIHAFVDGLDVFKRLKERRRKKKSRKNGEAGQRMEKMEKMESLEGSEMQLSHSLRQSPMDIENCYKYHYGNAGDRFAKGDATAHVSLAETLIKLNTGLVGIIAAFLNHDSKSNGLNLDYKSLTNLSNASRADAIESLNQLYQRVSQSQLQLYRMGGCARCGSPKHQNCSGSVATSQTKSRSSNTPHTKKRTRSTGAIVTRVPVKRSSGQTQLAIVRPKNNRKDSSSSSSSSSSRPHSTTSMSPIYSPIYSPMYSPPVLPQLPQYTPMDPYAPPVPPKSPKLLTMANPSPAVRRSIDGPRPATWPDTITTKSEIPHPSAAHPSSRPTSKAVNPPVSLRKIPQLDEKLASCPPVVRRRIDKATPSTYTFASDSTKLGEIPQKNWIQPFDYEEAEKLNAQVLVTGYPMPVMERETKHKKKMFGFLRRGNGVGL